VANHSIEIGYDCLIGDLVAIFDSDHHPIEPSRPTRFAPVRLGANVWVGRSVTILPGVTIGDRAHGGYLEQKLIPAMSAIGYS
jgi:acetyltransferase-like isoleucine patch superfamily enzyme